jgi:type II secretory pathway predicted ATPase ExeA
MYKQFYGLKRSPFEIAPDPQFYCPTQLHDEAWANLLYGVQKRKGFVLGIGEIGTGKTLLLHCFMVWLRQNHFPFSYIANTRLTSLELLQFLAAQLEIDFVGRSKAELLIQLSRYLINRNRQGFTAVLIVDEAHVLDDDLLEEIRLLSNLEAMQAKLLQIVLVGQPELEHRLEMPQLQQLKQRISLRCRLQPLSEPEIALYIARRLQVAGADLNKEILFPDATLNAIARYSRGIPRVINMICDNALLAGYARQLRSITPQIIEQVAADARLDGSHGSILCLPNREARPSEPMAARAGKLLCEGT